MTRKSTPPTRQAGADSRQVIFEPIHQRGLLSRQRSHDAQLLRVRSQTANNIDFEIHSHRLNLAIEDAQRNGNQEDDEQGRSQQDADLGKWRHARGQPLIDGWQSNGKRVLCPRAGFDQDMRNVANDDE